MRQYKVVAFNEDNGVITLDYLNGIVINLDLPVVNGAFPEGAELEDIIQRMYPAHVEQRKLAVSGASNIATLKALVEPEPIMVANSMAVVEPEPEPQVPSSVSEQEAMLIETVEETVLKILTERGLV
jgi:hypothetical protein